MTPSLIQRIDPRTLRPGDFWFSSRRSMALLRVLPSKAARAFLVVSDMCSKDTAIARYSPDKKKKLLLSMEKIQFREGCYKGAEKERDT